MIPTINSNNYDNRRTIPDTPPERPKSDKPTLKKRLKSKPKQKPRKIITTYTGTPEDLDLLGHYGSLGKNKLPVVTNADNVVDHIVDEYKTKLKHPQFKDWH